MQHTDFGITEFNGFCNYLVVFSLLICSVAFFLFFKLICSFTVRRHFQLMCLIELADKFYCSHVDNEMNA